jgi:hypothetical protein
VFNAAEGAFFMQNIKIKNDNVDKKKAAFRQKRYLEHLAENGAEGAAVFNKGKVVALVQDRASYQECVACTKAHEDAEVKLAKLKAKLKKARHHYKHLNKALQDAGALGDFHANRKNAHLGGATILATGKEQKQHHAMLKAMATVEKLEEQFSETKVDSIVAKEELKKFADLQIGLKEEEEIEAKRRMMDEWQSQGHWTHPKPGEATEEEKIAIQCGHRKQDARRRLSSFSKALAIKASYREATKLKRRNRTELISNAKSVRKNNRANMSMRWKEHHKQDAVDRILYNDKQIQKKVDARHKDMLSNFKSGSVRKPSAPKEGLWANFGNTASPRVALKAEEIKISDEELLAQHKMEKAQKKAGRARAEEEREEKAKAEERFKEEREKEEKERVQKERAEERIKGFEKDKGSWQCMFCFYANGLEVEECEVCEKHATEVRHGFQPTPKRVKKPRKPIRELLPSISLPSLPSLPPQIGAASQSMKDATVGVLSTIDIYAMTPAQQLIRDARQGLSKSIASMSASERRRRHLRNEWS